MCVFSSLGLIPLTLFSICGFTDMASNTAVTQSTLTDSMMLPSGCLWRHHQRQLFADFLKTGLCGALRASHHLWDGKQPRARKCRISLSLLSDGVVYTTALHRLSSLPVVPSSREWSVFRVDQHRPHHPHKNLTSILQWMEEDAFDGHCIHPPGGTEHRVIRRTDETASR